LSIIKSTVSIKAAAIGKKWTYLKLIIVGVFFDIFDNAGTIQLPEQLDCLLLGYIRPKIGILLQVPVQELYGLGRAEAVLVGAHVLLVPLERHVGPEASVLDPNSFFSDSDPQIIFFRIRIRILRLIF
jgi:hypothetical protein